MKKNQVNFEDVAKWQFFAILLRPLWQFFILLVFPLYLQLL